MTAAIGKLRGGSVEAGEVVNLVVVQTAEIHRPVSPGMTAARSLLKKAASPGVFAGFVFDDLG